MPGNDRADAVMMARATLARRVSISRVGALRGPLVAATFLVLSCSPAYRSEIWYDGDVSTKDDVLTAVIDALEDCSFPVASVDSAAGIIESGWRRGGQLETGYTSDVRYMYRFEVVAAPTVIRVKKHGRNSWGEFSPPDVLQNDEIVLAIKDRLRGRVEVRTGE